VLHHPRSSYLVTNIHADTPCSNSTELKTVLDCFELYQNVNFPTQTNGDTLDLVWTSGLNDFSINGLGTPISCLSCCSNSRALVLAMPRSWIRFPGKARTEKNINDYLEMQCKSLWIKASAKCNVLMYHWLWAYYTWFYMNLSN